MIDESVVQALQDNFRYETKKALATLAATGVILSQIQLEKERLLNGPTDEAAEDLTLRIKSHRLHVAYLQELHELCVAYGKELQNA